MMRFPARLRVLLAMLNLSLMGLAGTVQTVHAELPPPSAQQQQATAEKKAKADAQQAEEKRQLAESMDILAARWRKRASAEGWKTYPPAPVTTTASSQPASQSASQSANQPAPSIKSEKAGTAPPSEDIKPDKPTSIR